jgi:ADP-heptose:LPS heptosyltransferase
VLLTGPGEENLAETIAATARTPLTRCDDGVPTIDTLKATVSILNLLICNDSGSRHIAVAFRVPTVCIMGPTSPCYSEGPYERGEVIRVDVDCGPCQKPECDTDHRCMTEIQPEQVASSVVRLLDVTQ